MKVIVFVKADANSEAGILPDTELIEAMTKYNEELANAGVLLDGEGLRPSSQGKRIRFSGDSRSVVDGPFAETTEIVAGYWLWNVDSMDEAVRWAEKCPNPTGARGELELRPLFGPDDFGEALTPELREREDQLRQREQSLQK